MYIDTKAIPDLYTCKVGNTKLCFMHLLTMTSLSFETTQRTEKVWFLDLDIHNGLGGAG